MYAVLNRVSVKRLDKAMRSADFRGLCRVAPRVLSAKQGEPRQKLTQFQFSLYRIELNLRVFTDLQAMVCKLFTSQWRFQKFLDYKLSSSERTS